jgi:predicted Zn-dependent peptidase
MEHADGFLSERLESTVQVVGQPMAGVESAALGILVGTGARDESPSTFGISHFTEQMLFRGTEHLDAHQLSDRFDALGIDYDSSAGLEMTLLSAVLIGDRLRDAIDLLADVVRFPSFPDDALDNVRGLLLQEIRQREDRPGQRVMDTLRQKFFADSPLSNDVLGSEETIGNLTRDDLMKYWRERYTANNLIVSVAGNFDWETVIAQLRTVTASWPHGPGRVRTAEPPVQGSTTVMEKDTAQETIGFAFPGPAAADPTYYTAALLAQALGGGMNSRLWQEVREKRGLAYSVGARFDGLEQRGLFRLSAGTSTERAHESVEVMMDVLHTLERGGITDDELRLAKVRVKSQLVMRSESTSARMVSNLRSWWYEHKLHSLDEIKERIDHVTLGDVADLIESTRITDNLTVVALGPRPADQLFGDLVAAR